MLSITLFTEFSTTGTYLNNYIALSYMYVTKNAKIKLSTILELGIPGSSGPMTSNNSQDFLLDDS